MKILVTGGCGFIGSHLVDRLVKESHKVKVYDSLEPQVHLGKKPSFLNKRAEYIFADIRNKNKLKEALKGIDIVFHLASQVGVGQSMYEIEKYVSHNLQGTALLLNLIVNMENKIKKIIVASSMSIYGEGAYLCTRCGLVHPQLRGERQLKKKAWEMKCPQCDRIVKNIPTSEDKPLFPTSIYATTKRSQEEMCLEVGLAYKIPTVALRYFNVYGPRQSLSNPYTGVAAIFLSRVKNNKPPLVFEDGKQSRDFVYVSDIVEASVLAMEKKEANYDFLNVGTGRCCTILDIAQTIISLYKKDLKPKILHRFRAGDVRHCYANISKAKKKLGFRPKVSFREGMIRLIEWSQNQKASDFTQKAHLELKIRGLAQ
ncbi:MAG: SDR family NAD(P)-dependent oxidoreductase [Candidatus Omnitrophota bacterium]|nr:MAG: SDR family NAD(P)-dependent oxidoreductase [Candidatus Omnitrophota bacterium]